MTFNLVDEPWIVVRTTDGSTDTVSIRAAFHEADRIKRIQGDLPTQDFAVLRILLAIYYRVLAGDESDYDSVDLEQLWADGPPLAEIDEYLDRWHDRFDLFHPVHPFMQVPDLELASGEIRGLENLVPDCPGVGSQFTMRRGDLTISPAEAARWVVHCHAFDYYGIKSGAVGDERVKGGKGYPIGIGWAGWLGGVVIEGGNLRETLLHNFTPPKSPDDRDAPLWELAPLTSSARIPREIGPFGPLSLFTWPIRRIRLFQQGDAVTGVLICNGDPIDYWAQHTSEPMSGWRLSDTQRKKQKSTTPIYMPRTHDYARALWRGLDRLLPQGGETQRDKAGDAIALPARNLQEMARRSASREVRLDRVVTATSVGIEYGANMSSYGEIFTDAVMFYPSVTDPTSTSYRTVRTALARADGAARAVGYFGGDLEVAAGGDREPTTTSSRERAYTELDRIFRQWLPTVTDGNAESRLTDWTRGAREILMSLADDMLAGAPPGARALRSRDGRAV